MHSDPRRWLVAIAIALLVGAAVVPAQHGALVAPSGFFPNLEAYLESLRLQAGIPGMSAAVVQDGEIVWERGFGFQNVAARVRATPDTPYLVGDVTATLAAVLVLQCVEERRLSLDDPLGMYGISVEDRAVTVRKLLSHTSTGTFSYSPERFSQLTAVVEWCVPQPYAKTVSHRLLNRLAMRDSVPGTNLAAGNSGPLEELYDPADLDRYRAVVERIAVPYKVDGRGRGEPSDVTVAGISAAAGLVSTVRDLARFEAAVDSGLLLRDDTLAAAWSPTGGRDGAAVPAGLGWFVQPHRGERVVWHFGHLPNAYSSLVLKLPERRLTFILLANSDGLSAPFQLGSGDVTRSVFATLFLRLAS
ncbi:MAG: beta-lactamase family protein [Acidobacteriota bacterium]|nr:beta-lactamase family protein [Acidobacteriota bacterium]